MLSISVLFFLNSNVAFARITYLFFFLSSSFFDVSNFGATWTLMPFQFTGKEDPTQTVRKIHSLFAALTLPRSTLIYSQSRKV